MREETFPPKGFTGITGVEDYMKEQQKEFIREMNSLLHDEDCDCLDCLGIPSGVTAAPSWCPNCKQLRAEIDSNTKLLAATSDLYAACVEFVRKVEAGEARSTRSYAAMKAAIAKAKGEVDDGHV